MRSSVSFATQSLMSARDAPGSLAKSTMRTPAPVAPGEHIEERCLERLAHLAPQRIGEAEPEGAVLAGGRPRHGSAARGRGR